MVALLKSSKQVAPILAVVLVRPGSIPKAKPPSWSGTLQRGRGVREGLGWVNGGQVGGQRELGHFAMPSREERRKKKKGGRVGGEFKRIECASQ